MKKIVRRRLAYFVIAVLVVAMLGMAVWLTRHEPTLIEKATMVGPVKDTFLSTPWQWLSDTELLMLTTDREGNTANGFPWQGHADRWNVVTGERTPLPGLTALINSKDASGMPWLFGIYPDPKWIIWLQFHPDGASSVAAAHLDGSQYHELKASKEKSWPNTVHFYEQVLGIHRPPTVVSVDPSKTDGTLDIAIYRTIDADTWANTTSSASKKASTPLQKSSVRLPQGEVLYTSVPSPQQQLIVYDLHREQKNPILAWLHRIIPAISDTPIEADSLWVSKVDGTEFHKIGQITFPVGSNGTEFISNVEWLPGGKRVAFVHHHTLYTVPIDIPK